jgi:hypothetical protein
MTAALSAPSHARAFVDELSLDLSTKDDRIRLLIELMGAGKYVTRKTVADIYAVCQEDGIAVAEKTIEHAAMEAARIIRFAADPNSAANLYWQRSEAHQRDVDEYVTETRKQVSELVATSPREAKEASEAVGKALEAREKTLDRLGKVAGLLATPSAVSVQVEVGGETRQAKGTELAEFYRLTWLWFEQLRPDDAGRFAAWVESGGVLEVSDE